MAKQQPMTILRVRSYLDKSDKDGKTSTEIQAMRFLLDGLDEAVRIIEAQQFEAQCLYRVLQQIKTITDLDPVVHAGGLMMKDALLQLWQIHRQRADDLTLEMNKIRAAKEKTDDLRRSP